MDAPQTATHYSDAYAQWPIDAPVSRNFDCEITTPIAGNDGLFHDFDARLKLRASTTVTGSQRENWLSIILRVEGDEQWTNLERVKLVRELWEKLEARGFYLDHKARAKGLSVPREGTWRRYLLEVERAHVALEILGWELTAEEQAIIDALDAYGRQAPARYLEPCHV